MRSDRGLTLIELLIVIVILGILSSIIVFSVQGITDRGEASACEASTQTVRIASEAFRANDPQTQPAGSLQILADSGFLTQPLPGQINGNVLTLQSGGTITYNPADGVVTGNCPSS